MSLRAGGLVEAVAGRAGGYRLARPPAEIDLLAIVEAIEGDTGRQTCVLRGGPCGLDGTCSVHPAFFAAQEAIRTELRRATLEQLARRAHAALSLDSNRPALRPKRGRMARGVDTSAGLNSDQFSTYLPAISRAGNGELGWPAAGRASRAGSSF